MDRTRQATYAKCESGVISIRGGVATAAMAFVGLLLLTRTFARGCRRCRRALDSARAFDQQLKGDGYETRQKGAEKDLSAGEIAVLVGILESRAQV